METVINSCGVWRNRRCNNVSNLMAVMDDRLQMIDDDIYTLSAINCKTSWSLWTVCLHFLAFFISDQTDILSVIPMRYILCFERPDHSLLSPIGSLRLNVISDCAHSGRWRKELRGIQMVRWLKRFYLSLCPYIDELFQDSGSRRRATARALFFWMHRTSFPYSLRFYHCVCCCTSCSLETECDFIFNKMPISSALPMSPFDSKRKMIDPSQFFAEYGNANREHTGSPASHSMKMPNVGSLQLPNSPI